MFEMVSRSSTDMVSERVSRKFHRLVGRSIRPDADDLEDQVFGENSSGEVRQLKPEALRHPEPRLPEAHGDGHIG